MELFQESVLPLIQSFVEKQASVNWQVIAQEDERKEFVEEDISRIAHNVALIPSIDEATKVAFLGKLSLLQAQLSYFGNDEKYAQKFVTTGQAIEELVREFIKRNNLVDSAREQLDEIETFEESLEDGSATLEQLDVMRPTLVLMSLFGILMADKEMPEHDHCDDESCEYEVEEEDEE